MNGLNLYVRTFTYFLLIILLTKDDLILQPVLWFVSGTYF